MESSDEGDYVDVRSSDEGNDDYKIVLSTSTGKMRFRLGTEPVDLPTNFPITKDSALSDAILLT